jgi:hypothetical protein
MRHAIDGSRVALAAVALLWALGLAQPARAEVPEFSSSLINPFGLADVGILSDPALADLDGDGDLDALIGENTDTVYFENTGTVTAPVFAAPQTNPFGLIFAGFGNRPTLADLDDDGDLDVLLGQNDGSLIFFETAGTPATPAFAAPQSNPFGLADIGDISSPAFCDIDGDGDFDVLVGLAGRMVLFENAGTASVPSFAAPQTNPFGLTPLGVALTSPALADLDGDADLDVLAGEDNGNLSFFENTGTATAPAFAAPQTNPFGLADVGGVSSPTLADLDDDGDLDALVGETNGDTFFFENVAPACASAPLLGCDTPAKSRLLIKDSDDDTKDRMKLKLIGATPAREGSAFGDPTTTEAYLLCLYDDAALIAQASVSPDAFDWRPLGSKGFKYKDDALARDGTSKVLLSAGTAGNPKATKVIWLGRGVLLPDPAIPVTEPVQVTAQVSGSNGFCVSRTFTSAIENESNVAGTLRTFKAKNP